MTKSIAQLMAGAALCSLTAVDVQAQSAPSGAEQPTTLNEVIVTATRTGATRAQSTPLAVSVLSARDLQAGDVVNTQDLVELLPNLTIAQATVSPEIYIRGVGTNNIFNGSDPDVTTQLDGVYVARPYAQLTDYLDEDRVEVLRGPQGTLYGRNAVGGTINIISRLPTDTFQAQTQVEAGNYSLAHVQGYVSGALVPGLLDASIAGSYTSHTDYISNKDPGQPGVGNANHGGVKAQLVYTPTAQVQAITRFDVSGSSERIDSYDHLLAPWPFSPLANSTIGNYREIAIDSPQHASTEIWGVSEEVNFKISDAFAVKSLTAYRGSRYETGTDSDGTEIPFNVGTQGDNDKAFTQEFDVTIHLPRLVGVAGVYYLSETDESLVTAYVAPSIAVPASHSFAAEANPKGKIQSEAAFAQGTYAITSTLHFTAGIRYTRDDKSVEQTYQKTSLNPATLGANLPGFPFVGNASRVFTAPTPKVSLDWQITPLILAYVSVTKGWKSGGTNYAASNAAALSFAPETLLSYEAGLKSEWFDRRLRVNLTGFKYDYKDLQLQSLIGPGNTAISNAANAKVSGIEFESVARPIPGLLLSFNYSVLDAHYGSFTTASVPGALAPFLVGNPRYNASASTFNATGNVLNASPPSSYSIVAEYDHPVGIGNVFVRVEDRWQAREYFDPSNSPYMSQPAYSVVNLSLGYADLPGKWSIEVMAKNLANEKYLTTIAANGVVPAGFAGPPRTLFVRLSKNW